MKFKVYLYNIIRISFGMLLVLNGTYNVIRYSGFLDRLDGYFNTVSIFDLILLESLAPLVPFEEFVIGFFLALGMFKKKTLIASMVLFGFFTVFLFDAGHNYCALIHLSFCIISMVLFKNDNYDWNSREFTRNSYQII